MGPHSGGVPLRDHQESLILLGRAVQVHRTKPKLKPPGTKRLKLEHEQLLSNFAFNLNLRR